MGELTFLRNDGDYSIYQDSEGKEFKIAKKSEEKALGSISSSLSSNMGSTNLKSTSKSEINIKRTSKKDVSDSKNIKKGSITPKEIQTLVRAGVTKEEIAERYDVALDWVERFASTIDKEKQIVIAYFLNLPARSQERGRVILDVANRYFDSIGIERDSVKWIATCKENQPWKIVAIVQEDSDGNPTEQAVWFWDKRKNVIEEVNELAEEITRYKDDIKPDFAGSADSEIANTTIGVKIGQLHKSLDHSIESLRETGDFEPIPVSSLSNQTIQNTQANYYQSSNQSQFHQPEFQQSGEYSSQNGVQQSDYNQNGYNSDNLYNTEGSMISQTKLKLVRTEADKFDPTTAMRIVNTSAYNENSANRVQKIEDFDDIVDGEDPDKTQPLASNLNSNKKPNKTKHPQNDVSDLNVTGKFRRKFRKNGKPKVPAWENLMGGKIDDEQN
ncbi:MAG: DUF3071 domain-containing protein [Candidatus Ancillula sp.]|jgi:hypothetical protein|nr:DUF3071 domain-containing protein [Candidatus Ancillula sp.]